MLIRNRTSKNINLHKDLNSYKYGSSPKIVKCSKEYALPLLLLKQLFFFKIVLGLKKIIIVG